MAIIIGTNPLGDSLIGTEEDDEITGLQGNDQIRGNGGRDILIGGDGDDVIYGDSTFASGLRPGSDVLLGGAGNDSLHDNNSGGETGDSLIDGGEGIDTAHIYRATNSGQVMINLQNPAVPQVFGATTLVNVERIYFEGAHSSAWITGGAFDDRIFGSSRSDVLRGGDGNDYIVGKEGADRLFGDDGNDEITATYETVQVDGERGWTSCGCLSAKARSFRLRTRRLLRSSALRQLSASSRSRSQARNMTTNSRAALIGTF